MTTFNVENAKHGEDFSWLYKGFTCVAHIDNDCPYVRAYKGDTAWLVDFPKSYFKHQTSLQLALEESVNKLELLIDTWKVDPLIDGKLPRHLLDGYTFQCGLEELKEILSQLVVVPGQLALVGVSK